jgi:hypothetical protein
MRTLRLIPCAVLALLLISSILPGQLPYRAAAQPNQITDSKQALVQAFQSLQTAEQQGASNTDLLPLISQLNTALQFQDIAIQLSGQGNTTGSDAYALLSIQLSNQVAQQAIKLGEQAQTTSVDRRILAYGIALLAAILSSIMILEVSRIERFLNRRRLVRAKIVYGHVQT